MNIHFNLSFHSIRRRLYDSQDVNGGEHEWELEAFLAIEGSNVVTMSSQTTENQAVEHPEVVQVLSLHDDEQEKNNDGNSSDCSSRDSFLWDPSGNKKVSNQNHCAQAHEVKESQKEHFFQMLRGRSDLKSLSPPSSAMALFLIESMKTKSLPEPILSKLMAEASKQNCFEEAIEGSTKPLSLNLNGYGLGSSKCIALSKCIKRFVVRELQVEGNRLDASAVTALMQALSSSYLETLNLGGNKIDMRGVEALCELMLDNKHDEEIESERMMLREEALPKMSREAPPSQSNYMASFLFLPEKSKNALTSLSLQNTKLGDRCLVRLCSVLKLTRLSFLNLNNTNIGSHAAVSALGCMLEGGGMKTLKTLLLRWNTIGKAAADNFFDGLSSSRVATLDLSHNAIGDRDSNVAIDALTSMLETNNFLTHLDMSNNRLDATDCQKLSEALAFNNTLLVIHLTGNEEKPDDIRHNTDPASNKDQLEDEKPKGFLNKTNLDLDPSGKRIFTRLNEVPHTFFSNPKEWVRRDACWMCHHWTPVTFVWNIQTSYSGSVNTNACASSPRTVSSRQLI